MKRRLLIVGCGDVGQRLIPLARTRYRVYALMRGRGGDNDTLIRNIRELGATPIIGDLDVPQSLSTINGIAHDVVHLAPPASQGMIDTRTTHLIAALGKVGKVNKTASTQGSLPRHFVYISTSGVYGDCAGEVVPETRPTRPQTACTTPRAILNCTWRLSASSSQELPVVPGGMALCVVVFKPIRSLYVNARSCATIRTAMGASDSVRCCPHADSSIPFLQLR